VPTLGVLFAAFRMQSQRQDPSVVLEVLVSRKDRERSTGSYRQTRRSTLEPWTPAARQRLEKEAASS
jgi:hypothetical protein